MGRGIIYIFLSTYLLTTRKIKNRESWDSEAVEGYHTLFTQSKNAESEAIISPAPCAYIRQFSLSTGKGTINMHTFQASVAAQRGPGKWCGDSQWGFPSSLPALVQVGSGGWELGGATVFEGSDDFV